MSGPPPAPPRRALSPLLILALGLLLGRASAALPAGADSLVAIVIAGLLAISVTAMWRRWARRAMEQRRREQQQRRERVERAAKKR